MLALPAFLVEDTSPCADLSAIENAFRLTGFFFARHVYEARALTEPEARAGFLNALRRAYAARSTNGDTAA
jgi:DNA repair protein RecO (recombination protein O)